MTVVIKKLISSLDEINWTLADNFAKKVEAVLAELRSHSTQFFVELESFLNMHTQSVLKRSVETPTHFKWFIYENELSTYKIWIHEYKPRNLMKIGYAIVPHNHRYYFSSFVLQGGFKNSVYIIKRSDISSIDEHSLYSQEYLEKGAIYSLNSEMIHSLSSFKEPTITLIIQSNESKPYSESFDFKKKIIQRHYSFDSKFNKFKSSIRYF